MATEPSRVLSRLAALLSEEQGILHFSEAAQAKVGALVEVAARLPDDAHAASALTDVIRLAIALEDGGHAAAGKVLTSTIKVSEAALKRLAALRQRDKATFERFERFTQTAPRKVAPTLGLEVSEGVSLERLRPQGRLERPVRAPLDGGAGPGGPRGPRARGKRPEPERGLDAPEPRRPSNPRRG